MRNCAVVLCLIMVLRVNRQKPVTPWTRDGALGSKPEGGGDYGYIDDYGQHPCSREKLIQRCRKLELPTAVWVPESPTLVLPTQPEFLREVIGGPRPSVFRNGPAAILAALAVLVLLLRNEIGLPPFLVGFVAIVFILGAAAMIGARAHAIRRVRARLDANAIQRDVEAIQFGTWLSARRAPSTRFALLGLALVGASQLVGGAGESIAAAGLVKNETRTGDWWRLASAPLLHGGLLHFWYNWSALAALGRLVEAYSPGPRMLALLTISALAGGVASLLLLPAVTSIGASGGIMGLLGYLVLSDLRRGLLPSNVAKALWVAVALNAVIGAVGFMFIDNAAHAGGFITGALLGIAKPFDAGQINSNVEHPAAGIVEWSLRIAVLATAIMTALAIVIG